jgi:hypothetical protein
LVQQLYFGAPADLVALMQLPKVKTGRARMLVQAGYRT